MSVYNAQMINNAGGMEPVDDRNRMPRRMGFGMIDRDRLIAISVRGGKARAQQRAQQIVDAAIRHDSQQFHGKNT